MAGPDEVDLEKSRDGSSRAKIITSVTTPLGYFALLLLAVEVILAALAARAEASDFAFLVRAMVGILAVATILVALIAYIRPSALMALSNDAVSEGTRELAARDGEAHHRHKTREARYDAFVSAPMAAFADEEKYKKSRADVLAVIKALQTFCGYKDIYYAGSSIRSSQEFEAADLAFCTDFEAIRDSKVFLLIYPENVASSVLVEAGIAIALGKPAIYFTHLNAKLPFILVSASQAKDVEGLAKIRSYTYETPKDIINHFRINKAAAFGA